MIVFGDEILGICSFGPIFHFDISKNDCGKRRASASIHPLLCATVSRRWGLVCFE